MRKLAGSLAFLSLFAAGAALAGDLVPLKTELPKPLFVGTPVPINVPKLEPPIKGKRPDFMVPAGTTNLALKKPVTSSTAEPINGTLDLVTDGDKAGDEGSYVELKPGKQWVQIDLGQEANIYALFVWHFHSQERVYFDVVAQVSDDPAFGKGVKGRYVRLYSKGNTTDKLNHYIEIEVWGKPAE